MNDPRPAVDLADLRREAASMIDAFILLGGGLARSSKTITWVQDADTGKPWCINNEIDGSHQDLTDEELWTLSNIGEALDKGALFIYPVPRDADGYYVDEEADNERRRVQRS